MEIILREILEHIGKVVFSPAPLYERENFVFRYGGLFLMAVILVSAILLGVFDLFPEWEHVTAYFMSLCGALVLLVGIRWLVFGVSDDR